MLNIIEGILEGIVDVIIVLALIIITVIVATWLLELNSMSGLQQIAFNADVMINGEGVALFRNFQNHVMGLMDTIMGLL